METSYPLAAETLIRAQEGDQEAFDEIFEMFVAPLYRFALFRSGAEENAAQLTEEIFSKVWKDLRKFHVHGKMPFAVWVFQNAHVVVTRFLERLKKTSSARQQNLAEQAPVPGEENPATAQQDLFAALNDLPDTQAESVIFKYFCQLSTAESGLILEKSEGAVRILQSRGLKRLREILER